MILSAATIFERLAWAPPPDRPTPHAPQLGPLLDAWLRAYAPGNPGALQRRLAWDGFTAAQLAQALSLSADELPDTVPDWTGWIDRYLDACRQPASSGDRHGAEAPFVEILAPGWRIVREELDRTVEPAALARLSQVAWRALEDRLVRDLSIQAELALYAAFDRARGPQPRAPQTGGDGVYRQFIAGLRAGAMERLLTEHPVLARHVGVILAASVTAIRELVERLHHDAASIAGTFGQSADVVSRLVPALSDPHNGRRRVTSLTFDSGLSLVYKPRDIGLEQAFAAFLRELAGLGLDPSPRAPVALVRGDYGWVEFIRHEPLASPDAAPDWYRRAGALLCIAHLLRGRDLHMENVIATANGPVLIDLELLLQPVTTREATAAPAGSHVAAGPTCLVTGFVSDLQTAPDGTLFDVGGLRGDGAGRTPVDRRRWTNPGTDALSFESQKTFAVPPNNRPSVGPELLSAEDFVDEVLDGFERTYRLIHRHRGALLAPGGALDRFTGHATRVIGRPTDQYAAMLHLLAAPKYQSSGTLRSVTLDALNRAFATAEARPPLWTLATEERRSLERLDVPVFHARTDERAVYSGTTRIVEHQFARAGLDAVRDRIGSMNDADMDVQLSALRRALWDPLDARFSTPLVLPGSSEPPPAPGREVVAHALWIATELSTRAAGVSTPSRLDDFHLYDGALGPALFHAALAATTGDDVSRQAVADTVEQLETVLTHRRDEAGLLGACNGDGSIVYALTVIGRLLGDDRPVQLAARVAGRLTDARIAGDRVLDVSGGAAGAALALLALHRQTGDPDLLTRAALCGERLLATADRRAGECSWVAADGRRYVGFAHGAAGIAVALIRLFHSTGRREYLEAAAGAHQFEKRLYQQASANWPVTSGEDGGPGEVMTAWCHGAPGVSLARIIAATALQDPSLLAGVSGALKTTAAVPVRLDDHLCCGSLGRSDVLLTAGETLRSGPAIEAAWRIALGVVRRAAAEGRYRLTSHGYEFRAFDPGFFRGLSGIGYQLLRLAAPSRLPSVLAFELPRASSQGSGLEAGSGS